MWRSRILLIREIREMSRYCVGEVEGVGVLGMGATKEFFEPDGNIPVEIEELKIRERGK